MTTGERIREKRIESGMSMDELAERMGYRSRTSIYKIKHNITDLPLSKVAEFAKILNTTSAYLMGWKDEEPKPKYDPLEVKLIDPREKKLHENYTVLTEENRNTLFSYSTFLRSQQVLQAPAPDANLKAAHYREDIEVTDEMKRHDDDIMNDDDF